MSDNQHQAGQPPRGNKEKSQVKKSTPSKSAPTSPSSSRSSTKNPKRRPSSKSKRNDSTDDNDCENPTHTEDVLVFDRLIDGDNPNIGPYPDTSLPLWAHRYGVENLPALDYEANLVKNEFNQAYPLSDQHSADINLVAGDFDEATLNGSNIQDLSTSYEHQVHNANSSSTYSYLGGKAQGSARVEVAPEHLPTTLFDYQLGIWLYSACNTEITFSERVVKSVWEPHRLRL